MPSQGKENFFGTWNRSESSGNILGTPNGINFTKSYSRTLPNSPYHSKHNSPILPSSPISTSPPSSSPYTSPYSSPYPTLRRNFSSTFTLIPEDRALDIPQPKVVVANNEIKYAVSNTRILLRLILWWPLLMIGIAQRILSALIRLSWGPFLIAAPAFWLSACLWMFWKLIGLPLAFLKWILILMHTPAAERNRKKRTILISCGSTIQTLHLARNFHLTGARVVVFEFEGLFALSRFSTAVSKFYTIPKPTMETVNDYVAALCQIVEKESPSYYIPVSATSPAHFDAMAKPHLELLGCKSFIPGAQEVSVLDDTLEVFRKCSTYGLSLPPHKILTSKEDLIRLYDAGWLTGFRNIMMSTGLVGTVERHKFILPNTRRELKLPHEISEKNQWIVVRDLPGSHYVTCTTVKDSRVIANVTCLIQENTRSLIPEENAEIEKWLADFFLKVRLQRPINGHISFRFVKCETTRSLMPLGARVGVSLPYICYTGVHPRILVKPCPHFSRQNSGPLVQDGGRYWMHEAVMDTLKNPTVDSVSRLLGTVLDKREALFVYWDPLPYCAFYHFQLPFKSIKTFLNKRQGDRAQT